MGKLDHLLQKNREWAAEVTARDPAFFERLAAQQAPEYFWVGCSDSRVPANSIIDLPPGEVFVHRNVANMVKHADMNGLTAMQFAVDVLKVKHIIVCGHYGCGGVKAVLMGERHGLVDNWLAQLYVIQDKYHSLLSACESEPARHDLLCELNVIEQVANACQSTVVQSAWRRGQELSVHGWIYGIHNGLIRDLDVSQDMPANPDAGAYLGNYLGKSVTATGKALLTARENDIVTRAAIRTSSPDYMWGSIDGA